MLVFSYGLYKYVLKLKRQLKEMSEMFISLSTAFYIHWELELVKGREI